MEKTKKPKYNMWQNSGWMVRLAWRIHKSVLLLCLLQVLLAAGKSVAELLLAPAVLRRIETAAPLGSLLSTIAALTGALLLCSALGAYIDCNTLFGRVMIRSRGILLMINGKLASTSYPNTLDPRFTELQEQAARCTSSNAAPGEAIWSTWVQLLTNLLCFGIYLALLSGLSPWLMAMVTATAAVSYFVSKRINEWGYRHRDEKNHYDKVLSYTTGIACDRTFAKDIRIFGLRGWLTDLQDKTLRLLDGFKAREERHYMWANVCDVALTLLRNGIAYAFLIWLTLRDGLPASRFLLYFGAVTGFTQWVTGILQQFSELHKQSLDLSALREFLDWPEPFRFEGGRRLAVQAGHAYELQLENVSFRYAGAETDTLSHIDLTVRPGEKLAVVGLNGAGKTTLVKLLCGFLDPTEGRVLLDGADIRQYDRRDYYKLFTAVFQDFSVLEATVAENVAQRVSGIDRERVEGCLAQAGLTRKVQSLPKGADTPVGRKVFEDGVELSGGQTQRLMLARALYKDAPILLLDEPTAALDPIAENDIYLKYNDMTKGRTSVFISHRLASTRFCDRIIFLDHGVIAEEGTHQSLLAQGGGYARLFEVQSHYYREEKPSHEED